jgi:hypothetical protein
VLNSMTRDDILIGVVFIVVFVIARGHHHVGLGQILGVCWVCELMFGSMFMLKWEGGVSMGLMMFSIMSRLRVLFHSLVSLCPLVFSIMFLVH